MNSNDLFFYYTEGGSKIGILARRLLKIFRLERVTIAKGQGTSEDKNFDAKRNAVKNQFLNHVRYNQYLEEYYAR